jgi:ATP-dependent DNA helicase DinG
MKSPEALFTNAALEAMRTEIAASDGNEVFFLGNTDEARVVTRAVPLARGNDEAVPAITDLARPGDVVIHNHPGGSLTPSSADISIASSVGQAGVGFYIIDNAVTRVYEVVAAFEHKRLERLNVPQLSAVLMPGGPVEQKLNNYEHREQQIDMLQAVARAFNEDGIAAIEAGTGTGKTFAYLVPALFWALKNKERVVISTNTINLQEQLMKKDIPTLLSALDVACTAVLVKGRGNYVCLRKLFMLEREFDLLTTAEDRDTLKAIIAWTRRTRDGSRSDLNFVPKQDIWEQVSSESDTCMRARCTYFADCFVNKARREAASADLLIVNHHLLFADLSVRSTTHSYSDMAILPGYNRVIFDEAHNIEDSASSYFGARVTRIGLLRLLGRIYQYHKRKRERGLIPLIRKKLMRLERLNEKIDEIILDIQNEIIPVKNELEMAAGDAFDAIHEFIVLKSGITEREIKWRVGPEFAADVTWREECQPAVSRFLADLRTVISRIALLLKRLSILEKDMKEEVSFADERVELRAICNRLDSAAANIEDVLFGDSSDRVRWIETSAVRKAAVVRLFSVPVDVGPVLAEHVYSVFPTVVLTSATLTVVDRFDFIAGRIGLDRVETDRLNFVSLPSPFDFENQAIIGIPQDIPVVNDPQYRDALVQAIFRCLSITRGRAFILFTSFRMLNFVYADLAPDLERLLGISVLRQGDDNRTSLLDRFRRDTSSVLFATLSFWEGVDVEGESLECVALARLPFKVPDEPVTQARAEAIEKRGGNPFVEYSVPLAVIKFKQGFGRLIRNRTDRGAVLLLDKRVIERFYGQAFLNSLPPCRVLSGTSEEVFDAFQQFFASFRQSRNAIETGS